MTAAELIACLQRHIDAGGDRTVHLSIDTSTEQDPFARVFGTPYLVQSDGQDTISILSEQL